MLNSAQLYKAFMSGLNYQLKIGKAFKDGLNSAILKLFVFGSFLQLDDIIFMTIFE